MLRDFTALFVVVLGSSVAVAQSSLLPPDRPIEQAIDHYLDAKLQADKVTALAVSSPQRSTTIPGVQTLREAGLAAAEFDGWIGVFAPPGTTPETADRLHASFAAASRAPAVKAQMETMDFTARATRRDEFERAVTGDRARYAKVIESLGLKLE